MIEPLARRIAGLGWHVQLNMEADQIVENADMLRRLPTPIVFDHLGKLGLAGLDHPAYGVIRELLDGNRAWVKISGAYMNTRSARPRTPMRRASRRPSSRPPPSASCGAATGRTRRRPRSRMMRLSSIS